MGNAPVADEPLPVSAECFPLLAKESAMLVLSRRSDESIRICGNITITVLGVQGGRVKLGIDAPRDVPILRSELRPTSGDDVDPSGLNGSAVTDWESEGGGVLFVRIAA